MMSVRIKKDKNIVRWKKKKEDVQMKISWKCVGWHVKIAHHQQQQPEHLQQQQVEHHVQQLQPQQLHLQVLKLL